MSRRGQGRSLGLEEAPWPLGAPRVSQIRRRAGEAERMLGVAGRQGESV